MKRLWTKALVGTTLVVVVGGATVVGASALKDANAPKVGAEEALHEVFQSVDGLVNEVQLTLDDNQYEVEVESSEREYEFLIDATSGEIVEETAPSPEQEQEQNDEVASSVDASGYIEFEVIQKHVDTEGLEFQMVTDNQGKRILFLVNQSGVKQYKTIFIKNQNILEIIDVTSGGQVYRGEI